MRIRYDPEADVLIISLNDEPPVDSLEAPGGVIVSYGRDEQPVSIEFVEASARRRFKSGPLDFVVGQGE